MPQLTLEKHDAVYVLKLNNGAAANSFDDATLDEFNAHLDTVENDPANVALLITSDDAKFFSNGINLEYVQGKGGFPYLLGTFVPRLDQLLVRLALFGCPTVCAINGHAFGGGALLASVCDVRTMRSDRGFFCFPEIDIKLPFTPVMTECVNSLPNEKVRLELALTGRRIGGEEAAAAGIVHAAFDEATLLPGSLALAGQLAGKDRKTYAAIKRGFRAERWSRFGQ